MADFFCAIIFLGFFGILIYSTILRRKGCVRSDVHGNAFSGSGEALREARMSATKPTPVGLYCEICGDHAGVVSTEEYQRLEPPVYCESCKFVIERYRARV